MRIPSFPTQEPSLPPPSAASQSIIIIWVTTVRVYRYLWSCFYHLLESIQRSFIVLLHTFIRFLAWPNKPWHKLISWHLTAARLVPSLFTETEVKNCLNFISKKWYTSGHNWARCSFTRTKRSLGSEMKKDIHFGADQSQRALINCFIIHSR